MGNFNSLQRQKRGQTAPPTSSFARPVRPFAPLPFPSAQTTPSDEQASLDHVAHFGHSLAQISLLPPNQPSIETRSVGIQRKVRITAPSLEEMPQEKDASDEIIRRAAQEGLQTPSSKLPYAQLIQKSFGQHDVGRIRAHMGPMATASAEAMQASAYTTGNHVVFAGTPNLHIAAHEAAHVVQQRGGVQLAGGVGKVGDLYEQHADAVADRVMAGQSAEDLLDRFAGGQDEAQGAVRNSDGHNTCSLSTFPVQGYFKTEDFTAESQKDRQQMFTTQAESPTAKITGNEITMDRQILTFTPGNVKLLVSDDLTMAIHDTEHESKEFYATNRIVENSNAELEKVESAFRLDNKTDNSIRVRNRGRDHVLKMVKPVNYNAASAPLDATKDAGFVSLIRHICIEMTGELVGTGGNSSYEIVLFDPGARETYTEQIKPNSEKEEKVDRLAAFLAKSPDELDRAKVQEVLNSKMKLKFDYAQNYGTKSRKDKLKQASEALGVNEYALPEVGEGFATFSQRAASRPKFDYSAGRKGKIRENTWGYHFAGVVAKSIDGKDRITLENYRRDPQFRDVVNERMVKMFRKDLKDFKRANPKADLDEQVMHLLQNEQNYAINQNALASGGDPTKLWFFRMYGVHRGQTFHEKQAVGGGYVNPITVRVRRSLKAQKAQKLGSVDSITKKYSELLARITDNGAIKIIASLVVDLRKESDEYKESINKAANNNALMDAIIAIEKRFSKFIETKIIPVLYRVYAAVVGSNASKDVGGKKQLLDQVTASLEPTFMGILYEFFMEMHQGLTDVDIIQRESLESLRNLLKALPEAVFEGVR